MGASTSTILMVNFTCMIVSLQCQYPRSLPEVGCPQTPAAAVEEEEEEDRGVYAELPSGPGPASPVASSFGQGIRG